MFCFEIVYLHEKKNIKYKEVYFCIKTIIDSSFSPPVVCTKGSCLIYVICVCLRIVVCVCLFRLSSCCVLSTQCCQILLITPLVFSNVYFLNHNF